MLHLKTTHFSVLYENGTVRRIMSGKTEILRMIYSAVRDQNWGTVEPEIIFEKTEQKETEFNVFVHAKYSAGEIHFGAFYKIYGKENRLVFEMEGEAKSDFRTNRIGFCVLHPIRECAGKSCTVFRPDLTAEEFIFPKFISPHQPVKNINGLEWKPAKNIRAKLWFRGDIFEMEDQRNWTDASFKTYCRPLSLLFPFCVKKGEKFLQKIELEIESPVISGTEREEIVTIDIDSEKTFKIPKVGVGSASRREWLTENEAEILKLFPFDHLRCEIKLFNTDWKYQIEKAGAESGLLKVPLFLVIYFSENIHTELTTLKEAVLSKTIRVEYVLVVGKNHLCDDIIFETVFRELKCIFTDAKIGTGTNANFAELNRNRPESENAEFVSFSVNPQVHVFDETSLVENLEGLKYTVESTIEYFTGKPVFVSPVTFKPRFNVVATSEEPEIKYGELPPDVDVRQNSVFAAQWLLGCLKFLSQSGADLVTFFETVGWRGFVQGDFNPPSPIKFTAKAGDIFPVFRLLKEFAGFNQILFSESSSPLEVESIVICSAFSGDIKKVRLILTNFSEYPQKIKITGGGNYCLIKNLFHKRIPEIRDETIELFGKEAVILEEIVVSGSIK